MVIVAVYCRVSSEEQKKAETILTQREEATRYCHLHGLTIYTFYFDDGVSGMLPFEQRPGGKRLLADAAAGKFTEVVVYKTARLGRDFYDTVPILDLLRQHGLLVRSVTEHYDAATPDGRFMQGIHTIVASKAREDIVEQSIAGCNRVASLGTWMGGNRPFGYNTRGHDAARVLVVNDAEAEWVRAMFRWLVVERMTCNAIARRLNSLGIRTPYAADGRNFRGEPSSGLWIASRVRNLLINPLYKGVYTYGRKSKVRQPIVQTVAALVDEPLWEAAQQRLRENQILAPRNRKREYLLSGKIRCALCGRKYVGIQSHGGGKLNYICKSRNERGLKGCSCPNVAAAVIEAIIWERLEAKLRNPGELQQDLLSRSQEGLADLDSLRTQIATVVQRQEGKKRERQRLIDLYTSDAVSREDYLLKYQRLNQDEEELTAEEEALRSELRSLENAHHEVEAAGDYVRAINEALDANPTWEEKREWVRRLVSEIVVSPDPQTGGPLLDWAFLFSPLATCSGRRSFIKRAPWGWLSVPVRLRLAA